MRHAPLAPCGGFARVATLLQLAAASRPGDEAFLAGNMYYGEGRLDEASEAYNICLKLAPERTDCATNLASVLVDQGNEALAEGLYRRVLAIDESHADAAFNLGLLLQDRKTDAATREAAKLYQVAVAKEPARWDAWANLAAALKALVVAE